jgi:leucyl/phenylalanyl-tRNA--protein transferase
MTIHRSDPAYAFPSVDEADENGFLAYGGDLSPERLIAAYESGIFPWYEESQPILWWCPPKRMVLFPDRFKYSKSLRQIVRSGKFELAIDHNFKEVIHQCAITKRVGQLGTWITPEMKREYGHLHRLGFAHSFEAYQNGELVGGLYGVALGKAFFGESMFTSVSNASKVAFQSMVSFLQQNDFHLIDCQLHTAHLQSLGAEEIERSQYMQHLQKALDHPDLSGKWKQM